jgi:hypothetical protein
MNFTFCVSEEEANLMAAALMELPYKTVADLVTKINQQALEQRQAAEQKNQDSAE